MINYDKLMINLSVIEGSCDKDHVTVLLNKQ